MKQNQSMPQTTPLIHPAPTPKQQQGAGNAASQQQSASEPASKEDKQMGEGSYEGTRDYNERTADYLKSHDVEADARAAAPKSATEAEDLKEAEKEGKSRSKGE